jgi:hypothetical protein
MPGRSWLDFHYSMRHCALLAHALNALLIALALFFVNLLFSRFR